MALRQSLARIPLLRRFLANCAAAAPARPCTTKWTNSPTFSERLEQAIAEDPPALASDPGVIRRGFNAELDQLRDLSQHSRQIIAAMEERERKRTGIASLKIRYNQVFGFYIEVSKRQSASGPRRFRAQANAGQRRALHHAGAQRVRTQGPRRR